MRKFREQSRLTVCRERWGILAGTAAVLLPLFPMEAETPGRLFRNHAPVLRPFLPEHGHHETDRITEQEEPPRAPTQFNPDPGSWDRPQPAAESSADTEALIPELHLRFGAEEPIPAGLKLPRGAVLGRDPVTRVFTYHEYPLGREGLGALPNTKVIPNRWELPFPQWTRYQDPRHETAYMYTTPQLWHPYKQSRLKGDVPIIGQDIFANITAKNFTLTEYRRLPTPSGVSTALPNSTEFYGRGEQFFISNDTSIAFDIFKGETSFKPVTWLLRVNAVYNQNWIRAKENNVVDPDVRGAGFVDDKGTPNTSVIQAIKPEGGDVNPRAGTPAAFSKIINPPDLFNYIAPQLQPLGDARPLVKVDPETQEVPEEKEKDLGKKNKENKRHDFAGTRYTTRHKDFFALQEAFLELHISDLSDNYDFISSRFGIQPFISDFRGFIYADTNLGARIFGNADNNRWQYNLVYFNQREKDTYSDLNTFDSRHQQILIANVFRQDLLWKGYTGQLSFHMNLDDGGTHYDKNGFLTRPLNLGTVPDDDNILGDDGGLRGHDVKAFYLGWAGDGHIGHLNITHAFYQVFGEDEFNGLAGRKVDINAQMAALELSYDRDWIRFKLSGFYASGDSDPTDRTAKGFDSIVDNPLLIGGPFSWYVHQGFNLGGTAVAFKQRDSLIPNLRSSKTEGQSNFVNPGVMIAGLGTDIDVTPRLKAFANVNYIWLAETKPIEVALQTNKTSNDLGLDASIGFKFRPLLTENIILSAGVGFFFPGQGYKDIYRRGTTHVPGFGPQEEEGKVDKYLYNGFFTLTFLY